MCSEIFYSEYSWKFSSNVGTWGQGCQDSFIDAHGLKVQGEGIGCFPKTGRIQILIGFCLMQHTKVKIIIVLW